MSTSKQSAAHSNKQMLLINQNQCSQILQNNSTVNLTQQHQFYLKEQAHSQIDQMSSVNYQYQQLNSSKSETTFLSNDLKGNPQSVKGQNYFAAYFNLNKPQYNLNQSQSYKIKKVKSQGTEDLPQPQSRCQKQISQQINKNAQFLASSQSRDKAQVKQRSPIKSLLQPFTNCAQMKTSIFASIISSMSSSKNSETGLSADISKSFPVRRPQIYCYNPFLSEPIQILPFYYPLYKQKIPKRNQVVMVQKLQANNASQSSEKHVQIQFTVNFKKQALSMPTYLKNKAVKIESLTQMPINSKKLQRYQFLTTVSKPVKVCNPQQVNLTQQHYQRNIQQQIKLVNNIFSYTNQQSKINSSQKQIQHFQNLSFSLNSPYSFLQQKNPLSVSYNAPNSHTPNNKKRQYNSQIWQSHTFHQVPQRQQTYARPESIFSQNMNLNFQFSKRNSPFDPIYLDFDDLSQQVDIKQPNTQRKAKIELCSPKAQRYSCRNDAYKANLNKSNIFQSQRTKQTESRNLAIQMYQKIAIEAERLKKNQYRKKKIQITQANNNVLDKGKKSLCRQVYYDSFKSYGLERSKQKLKTKMNITLNYRHIIKQQDSIQQSTIQPEYAYKQQHINYRVN